MVELTTAKLAAGSTVLPATAAGNPNQVDGAFSTLLVRPDQTLYDALVAINNGGVGLALVTNRDGLLQGVLSDGDVRRALLQGKSLQSKLTPHVCREFTVVTPNVGRAEVLDLMRALLIEQIPVVDENGRLVGLHLIHTILGAIHRPNWAVIMAGGRGTRLHPYTETVPKPMLKVAGRPLLERLILHLVGFGVRRVFLAINYLGHIIENYFGDGARFGCRIDYLREEQYLGTGGALALLPEQPESPLLVMNGDLVTQVQVGEMLDYHTRGGQLATMGVRPYTHEIPFGCIQVDGDRVTKLEEKPVLSQMINAGIYVLAPALLRRVPRGPFPITSLIEECLQRKEHVAPFEVLDDWVDVGQHETLKEARAGNA